MLRPEPSGVRPAGLIEAVAAPRVAGDARDASAARLFRIAIGQQLQAEVLDAAGSAGKLVRVAGAVVQMSLPESVQPGDTLTLTLVARDPRPTFLLQQPAAAVAELSGAARLIAELLGAPAPDGKPPAVEGKFPLIRPEASRSVDAAANGIDAGQLAATLRQALSSSGVFYESHLRRWADDDFPLADLLHEPQSRIGRFLQPGSVADAPRTPEHAQMAQLFAAQLDTHEHARIAWQGDAWPGQPMRWTVERRDRDAAAASAPQADATPWHSTIRVELPSLGMVAATLQMHAGGLTMRVSAGSDGSVAALRGAAASLADAFAVSGLRLGGLAIARDDEPESGPEAESEFESTEGRGDA
ncbi:MAG: flagellar hook-length control protein FliK [Burkholderiaceae bacterium]